MSSSARAHSIMPLISISLAVLALVGASVLWSVGTATFDTLSFVIGCIASAVFFAAHHHLTHSGAHS